MPRTGIICGFAIFYLFGMKQGIMYCGVAAPQQEPKKKKIQYKGREIIDQQYIKLEDLVKSY